MSTCPRLTAMGVANPQHIAEFSINNIDYTDYLRITYDRPKGSLLPFSRTYKFPRVQKAAKSGDGGVVMESCPELLEAVEELQQIIGSRKGKQAKATAILDELHHLEEDFAMHFAKLKALVEQLDSD